MIETIIKSTETIENNNFERIGNGFEFKLPKDSRSKEVSDSALDAKIEAAAHSAGVFFNLPEATIEKGNTIGVRTKDGTTFKDDVFVYNLEQFKKMECTSFEDVSKVWSHECGHRLLQIVFPNCWADELGADFFTGVRSEMLGLPKGNFEKMLSSTKASESHPNGALRIQAMDYGRHVAAQMKRSGIQPTWDNCLEAYTKSLFATMTYENANDGNHFSFNDNQASVADAKSLERMGHGFVEQRDFGIDRCTEAAIEIFNPEVIQNWVNLSLEQRKEIAGAYAAAVGDAFDLKNYTGVIFEDMEPDVYGYNNGDGSIHLSNDIIAAWTSPLEIMNTITHELRHQYQSEAIRGLHNIPEDVVKEWTLATDIYNYDQPYCYDPWGYTYNPLEIDARYAGETVVRNYTHDMINA